MENLEVKRPRDFIVANIDVYVLRKGNRWIHVKCLRNTQEREPASFLIKYPEWMENCINENEQYTLTVSIFMDVEIKTNSPMIGFRIREIKPFILNSHICSKCKVNGDD